MAKTRRRLSLAERQEGADPTKATTGTGFPRIPVSCTALVQLVTVESKVSEHPSTRGNQLVFANFKVLEVLEYNDPDDEGKVKEGRIYSTKMDLDKEFNEGNAPDSDRFALLAQSISDWIKSDDPDDYPSLDDVYASIDDGDIEAFDGVVLQTTAARRMSQNDQPYTLHVWEVPSDGKKKQRKRA